MIPIAAKSCRQNPQKPNRRAEAGRFSYHYAGRSETESRNRQHSSRGRRDRNTEIRFSIAPALEHLSASVQAPGAIFGNWHKLRGNDHGLLVATSDMSQHF